MTAAIDPASGRRALRSAPLRRDWHDAWRGAAVGVALLASSWALLALADGGVQAWERGLFRAVNDLPDPVRSVLWLPMQLGSSYAWMLAVPVLAVVYRRFAPGVAAALAGWSAYLAAQLAKELAGRGRPATLFVGVHVRTVGADGNGYPSGHAAVAAAIVTALLPWVTPRTRRILWVLVGSVAFARVFFGVHLPLDVIGGVGIGMVCGSVATAAVGVPARARPTRRRRRSPEAPGLPLP